MTWSSWALWQSNVTMLWPNALTFRSLLSSWSIIISQKRFRLNALSRRLRHDSISITFCLSNKMIGDILRLCSELLKKVECSLRQLAKIKGNLIWAAYVVHFSQAHFNYSLYKLFLFCLLGLTTITWMPILLSMKSFLLIWSGGSLQPILPLENLYFRLDRTFVCLSTLVSQTGDGMPRCSDWLTLF